MPNLSRKGTGRKITHYPLSLNIKNTPQKSIHGKTCRFYNNRPSLYHNQFMASSLTPLPERVLRGNIWRLSLAQALAGANAIVVYATGAVIGNVLAPSPVLATLPISIFVVGMAASIFPMGALARRFGRLTAFMAGTGAGVLAGLLAAAAVILGWFWLFCLATFLGGAYAAVVLSFRFAATDGLAPERQAKALALVMAGGVAAGIVGPQLINATMDIWPAHQFAASFIAQAAAAGLSAIVLSGVQLPPLVQPKTAQGRPIGHIIRQPRFIAAVIGGSVSYLLMNFLMTAAPLAMRLCGHDQSAANWGLQWHVIAMYAPSFFTGKLITRYGAMRLTLLGLALTGLAAIWGLLGTSVSHFWGALIVLGLGWNFGFLGASALVLACHRPEETMQVQTLNDFIIFALMAIGSLLSGSLLAAYGWNTVLWVSFAPLAFAFGAMLLTQQVTKRTRLAT